VQKEWDLPARVMVAELAFQPLAAAGADLREYRPVSRFPAVTRDVALVVGQEIEAAKAEETIRTAGGDLVTDVLLFDLYQGERMKEGQRSLAFRITYQGADRTLTDAEVEAAHGKVRAALQALGAELRS
jgi:phenylalanyl-tRNA synthetase beta chain